MDNSNRQINQNQSNDVWQAKVFGQIYDTNFAGITGWINEGAIQSSDKVRRGNLRWIEAGKISALLPFFNAKGNGLSANDININHVRFSNHDRNINSSDPKNCFIHAQQKAAFQCEICLNGYCQNCFSAEQNKNCPMCGAHCRTLEFNEAPEFSSSSTVNTNSTFADAKSAQNFGSNVRLPSDILNEEEKGISIFFVVAAAILVSVLGAYVWAYSYNVPSDSAVSALPEIAKLDEKLKTDLEKEKENDKYRVAEKKQKEAFKKATENQYPQDRTTQQMNKERKIIDDSDDQIGFVKAMNTKNILKEAGTREREKIIADYRETRSKQNFAAVFIGLAIFSFAGLMTVRTFMNK